MKIKICLFLVALIISNSLFSKDYDISRVEPTFWWTGMKDKNLQLLVHGKNIANARVSIDYNGVILRSVIEVENPNYVFINLYISEETKPGKFSIHFKLDKKIVQTYQYELKARVSDIKCHQGFDASDVIYLLMPDRFSNGNTSNDSHENTLEKADRNNLNGRHGGDITGIINHLDYFSKLGVTALWLNPFFENNMPLYSYHGYAFTDLYKTDPRFGSNDDYVKLVNESHKRGLKIIMDMVFNHCGSGHWWMNDVPSSDWFHEFPEFTSTNYRAPTACDPYVADFDSQKMLNGWFDKTMPDLNQSNPLVANYLIQNTIWWIEYAGIDGIRMDTQPYAEKEMMADWAKRIFEEYPQFNIVGESWLQKEALTAYWQKDANNVDGYNSHIPSVTDFPMCFALNAAFNEKPGWTDGIMRIYYVLVHDILYADPFSNLIFLDNHDLNRFASSVNDDLKKVKLGMTVLFTTRGIPQMYYGTEIMMLGHEHKGHGYIRTDFPGGWVGDTVNVFTKTGLSDKQTKIFNYTQKLLNWRKNAEVIHTGKLKHFLPENDVYVYFRYNNTKTVMVIINNSDTEIRKVGLSRFSECIKTYESGTDIISGNKIQLNKNIELQAKSALILELE